MVSGRSWTIVIVVVAAAVVAAAVLLVWRPFDSEPAVATKAVGTWQEQTTADPVRMTVIAVGEQDGVPQYTVTLPASSKAPSRARLEGDAIVIRGGTTQDVVWRVTYDEGADVLLLARPDGSERHILRRVRR
jgi:hypothetical protein